MKKFEEKIESIRAIIDYVKENMVNEKVFEEVRNMVKKIKDYYMK